MKLEHFHYLLEIHRFHSISAASRKLHIGQTTLSAIVKAAEEEVGFQIFQRAPEGVLTTSAGEKFMTLAWEINLQYEKLMALKRRTTAGAPSINVLMAPTISVRLSIPLLEQFYRFNIPVRRRHPPFRERQRESGPYHQTAAGRQPLPSCIQEPPAGRAQGNRCPFHSPGTAGHH